ncbi:DNA-directed RNA polymerase, alpha subunit, putative [Plasmodium reichenowi]|uniref:DNA-directed RNA polymerase, alpha subunit, putative n=1 Tax=Plasmodium reichenowi TaxID=5854 RepID=A0A151L5Y7_PLARE|nr:DNA-directed RNA polymerase, alpha subunit, putative [Plasmodium reichenowi]KYN94378.1 DNA-directed RNA polymerase, alpha subunit, putative [Plasmodium reichenowi]
MPFLVFISLWLHTIIVIYKCVHIFKSSYISSAGKLLMFERKNKRGKIKLILNKNKEEKNIRRESLKKYIVHSTDNDKEFIHINDNYKIFQKKNFIKKYHVKDEEIKEYLEQINNNRASGYEPKFPEETFRTPDGLTNIILDYKYKNDNLKIHNYYYFFLYFLKKLRDEEKRKIKLRKRMEGKNDEYGDSINDDDDLDNRMINVQEFLFLKKKGFFEGELYTWKNWVLLNRGEWRDTIVYGDEDDNNCGNNSNSNSNSSSNINSNSSSNNNSNSSSNNNSNSSSNINSNSNSSSNFYGDDNIYNVYNNYHNERYDIKTLRPLVEPKMKRMPIEYWGSFRAIDFNVNHYPIYKKLFDYFNKVNVNENDETGKFYPFLFFPRFGIGRDRLGLGYGDAQYFGNYGDFYEKRKEREERLRKRNIEMQLKGNDNDKYDMNIIDNKCSEKILNTNIHKEIFIDKDDFGPNFIKIEEATDIIKYPQNGKLYQKFYLGPLNITDGHTFGSLIKYVCQTQIYGYAIVAIKVHNMNEDTKINNVQEDLLEIALNISDVCIYSKEINLESNIRLIFKGPLMLVAGMIPLPSHLKIINKEHYICTIKEDGFIDISIKIEYGKGHWLTYDKGLYKRERGSDNDCMKKREIKEVVNKNYMPISSSFGACRMIRLTVHKIATKFWCEDRCEFTDPKQMLVVEIWTDCRMLPKNVLLYGIKNIKKILRKFREMIIKDTDFTFQEEEQEIKNLWPAIDKYKYLQTRQKMEGGPPIHNIDEDVLSEQIQKNKSLDPFSQELMNPDNFPKHSNIQLPIQDTPPPFLDTLEWLKMELKKENNKNNITQCKNTKWKETKNKDKFNKKRTFDYDEYLNHRLSDILNEK